MDGTRLPFWQGLLPAILRQVYVGRRSGLLSFIRGEERRSIRFISGHIAHVESNIDEDHLGQILVRRGLLSRDRLERAARVAEEGKQRLGTVLVEAGLLDTEGLEIALAHHVRHVLSGLFSWNDGAYEFIEESDDDPPLPDVIMTASTGDFILAAARGATDPDTVRYNLGDIDRPVVVTTDPLLRFQRLTLSAVDGYILSHCDGKTTARDILRESPFGVDSAQRSLYGLLCTGVIQYPNEEKTTPIPPSGTAERVEPPAVDEAVVEEPGAAAAIDEPPETGLPPLPPAPARKRAPFVDVETIPIRLTEIAEAMEKGGASSDPDETAPPVAVPMDARRAEVVLMSEGLATRTHFEVLGVSWDAEEAEIREAYYRLARRFHPDAHHEGSLHDLRDRLEDIFVRLGEAYEVLRNWHLRAAYERKVGRARPEIPLPADEAGRARRAEEEIGRAADSLARDRAWEAIRLLEWALPHAEGRARSRGRLLLASIYSRSVYWARQAEDLIRSVQKEDPSYAEAHLALARLYKQRGLGVRAVTAIKKALALAPSHPEARALLEEMDAESAAVRGGFFSKLFARH